MRCSFLFILLNMTSMSTVTCFKPNVFWNRAKTMTKFISGEVYRRTKTAILPIVARTKITNGGFYEGKHQSLLPSTFDNKVTGNHMYQGHVASGYMPQPAPVVEDPHSTNGLYEEYRRTMSSVVPEQVTKPLQTTDNLYENYRNSVSVVQPSVPTPAPAPMSYTHGLAMPTYAPTPVPVSAPVPSVSSYTQSTSSPIEEKKQYSTDGLYEEYRKSLQNTNELNEPLHSANKSPSDTLTGFYNGPKNSLDIKQDNVLYEPPTVVKSPPPIDSNRYTNNGFYQGQ